MKREKIVQLIPSFPNDVMRYHDGDVMIVKDVSLYALSESGEIYALVRGTLSDPDVWMLVDPPMLGRNIQTRNDDQKDLLDELDKTADKSDDSTTPE